MSDDAASKATARFSIHLLPSGWRFEAGQAETLLRAARDAGIRLPSACRNGTCRRCICRLQSGRVTYRVEWPGLSREEKAEGWVLPCVAVAATPLEIEAPLAHRLAEQA